MADGSIKVIPPFADEEYISAFTKLFNETYPPPEPGTFPVKYTDVVTKADQEVVTQEENRWRCVGGCMDENEGIAKVLKLKKGRGRNSIEVLVPINPASFTVEAGGKLYRYFFDGTKYICTD